MKYAINLTKRAQKDLGKLQEKDLARILRALRRLEEDPRIGFPLVGRLKGRWKLRVGGFRIIYTINDNELIIIVITVGHRRDIYRREV